MKSAKIIAVLFSVLLIASPLTTTAFAQIGDQSGGVDFSDIEVTEQELAAVESEFSETGALPGEFFYPFKRFGEGLGMAFTFNKMEQAKKHLELAKIRLAEAKALVEKEQQKLADQSMDDAEEQLNESDRKREELQAIGQNISELIKEAEETSRKSELVLNLIREQVPEQARAKIDNAMQKMAEHRLRLRFGPKHIPEDELEAERVMQEMSRASMYEKLEKKYSHQLENMDQRIAEAQAENNTEKLEKLQKLREKLVEMHENRLEKLQEFNEKIEEKEQKALERMDNRITEIGESDNPDKDKIIEKLEEMKERMQERSERMHEKIGVPETEENETE
ncbi:MAG: hypothetical protein HZB65_00795 [Candidatus Aenigmarchaeota archaeon]|nr:hypothetical protein [Candidatus Aenigmarchaeota archaeon]